MKTLRYFALPFCLLSLSVQARFGRIEANGFSAERLYRALESVGVRKRPLSDRDVLEARDLRCLRHSNEAYDPPRPPSFDCELSAQLNEDSSADTVQVGGESARALFEALEACGLSSDCGMGKCGMVSPAVSVEREATDFRASLLTESVR